MKVLCIFGTRPEAIKMCPLVLELNKRESIECKVCLTGQHKEMLKQVMDAFNITAEFNLDIMRNKQTLTTITVDILSKIEEVLVLERPDIVLVHGDTTTSFVAALAAFYQKIPVGHVEAGLRTSNIYSPYPEELNRQLTGRIALYHFAPTESNRENLLRENITDHIYVTGNTVIDAFSTTVKKDYHFNSSVLNELDFINKKVILVTAHRRENLGKPLENICGALYQLAENVSEVEIVYPVHLNPTVRETVERMLSGVNNVHLVNPLDVMDMHNLIARCYMVMTDSGGLQEEAPACGKPVLVMRTETERPEAVEAGTVKVIGVDCSSIYEEAYTLLSDYKCYEKMAKAVNPYGDGHASERIADVLVKALGGE